MIQFAIVIISGLVTLVSAPSTACDLIYEVRSGDEVSELCVAIEKNTDGTTYRSTYRDVKQLYHYNVENALTRWEFADSGAETDFKATRNGAEISIRGISRGQSVDKTLTADDHVWLQNSEFGLLEFLKTNKKIKEFIVVAPEDLSIKRLRATRVAEEEISWNGKRVRAIKTTARLRGFLSLFWQSTYWHRLPEMTFLRYKADGLPGVPEVDIRLLQENARQ
jgi:hypothetical protein